jgi:hypothetical protein
VKSDPLIFLCKAGSITQPSKVALRKTGVIVVESTDVEQCKLLQPRLELRGDEITRAAIVSLAKFRAYSDDNKINAVGRAQEEFVKLLAASYREQEPSK